MNEQPITVLKFGGSVLRNNNDILRAVHEIYRWIRQGHRVVAVVSAFEGCTDGLLRQAEAFGPQPGPQATALLVSTGELTSASTLGLALTRAGLTAHVATPGSLKLHATGGWLDSDAQSVSTESIFATLRNSHVLVVPGFVGINERGDTVLLGRGGSDLTALFLAQQLHAKHCRLIKDVDGLYERDPALPGPPPRRISRVSWDHALALGGGIVQPKAIRFAREHALRFEVGTLNREGATVVDQGPLTLDDVRVRTHNRRPLRVLLIGTGTVGLGVYKHLVNLPEFFEVTGVVCRETERPAREGVHPWLLSTNAIGEIERGADVVVELIGGTTTAADIARATLISGAHLVTANKSLIAEHGRELRALAARYDSSIRHSAAVGGVAPLLESLATLDPASEVLHLEGVINGTTNYVLNLVAQGASFDEAVAAAQRAGLAEADPSRDLSGLDEADKLALIAREAFGVSLDPRSIKCTELSPATIAAAQAQVAADNAVLRHIARISRRDQRIVASVDLVAIATSHTLADLEGPSNRIVYTTSTGVRTVEGIGAGRWPTAESVIADLLDLARLTHGAEIETPALTGV